MQKFILNFTRKIFFVLCGVTMLAGNIYGQNFADHRPFEQESMEAGIPPGMVDPSSPASLKAQTVMSQPYLSYEGDSQYTLGPNDVIDVTVMRHPEVSGQYVINSEGKIQYGFVGDVVTAGLTKAELAEEMITLLSKFIISPEVTVTILQYNSKVVYVIGEVARPGKVIMQGDTITIREALIQAGLPLLSAKLKKSKLITPSADNKPIEKRVNIEKLLNEGDLRENLVMSPGDMLYVPPTRMTKVMRAIQPVAQPITTGVGAGRTVVAPFP